MAGCGDEQIEGMLLCVRRLVDENEQLREAIMQLPAPFSATEKRNAALPALSDLEVPTSATIPASASSSSRMLSPAAVTYRLQFTAPPSSPSSVSDPTPQAEILEFVAKIKPTLESSRSFEAAAAHRSSLHL